MLNYIEHNEINRDKWDKCISCSVSGLIYAYSWYLDIVSPYWDALVNDDYSAVMPLTWKRKSGIYYLHKPVFTQQLGIFSSTVVNKELVKDFINEIPVKFKLIHICLNENNPHDNIPAGVSLYKNYKLSLSPSYNQIYGSYSRNCRRNIKKAIAAGLTVNENVSLSQFTDFVRENLGERITELKHRDYNTLKSVLKTTLENKTGKIYGVFTSEKELCAVGSFLYTDKRCIFSICASSEEGKSFQAMYLLVNHEIENNSGKNMFFDFSGSNIAGIAYFNSTFGAEPVEYPLIYINNLPWFIRIFKK